MKELFADQNVAQDTITIYKKEIGDDTNAQKVYKKTVTKKNSLLQILVQKKLVTKKNKEKHLLCQHLE